MKKIYLKLAMLCLPFLGFSNGIQLSNLSTSYNSGSGVCKAVFDLSWENSWRTNAINNWDAAWVFFKFKEAGVWKHLDLTSYDITLPSGFTSTVPSDKKGIFIYRSGVGTGNVSLSACEVGVVPKMGTYDIKAFGLEMVYIPTGSFYVGDGNGGSIGRYRAGGTGLPYQITNGDGGNYTMGNTYYYELSDSFGNGTMAYGFPTGYDAFYCMKYELSQGAWCDFLNCLTYQQQAACSNSSYPPNSSVGTNLLGSFVYRQSIEVATSGTSPNTPAVYGCDANGNNTYNETEDGEWIPKTYLRVRDMASYLDWSGLRPMTELEYEKICRGTATPSPGEYAWGTNTVDVSTFSFSGPYKAGEIITNTVTYGSAAFNSRANTSYIGPVRSGIFATSSSGRVASGATYYGSMEMSGNLAELCITTSTVAGRSFIAINGNGELNLSGEADVSYWPGINGNTNTGQANGIYNGTNGVTGAAGIGMRGGDFDYLLREVSNRASMASNSTNFMVYIGIRGVRSPN